MVKVDNRIRSVHVLAPTAEKQEKNVKKETAEVNQVGQTALMPSLYLKDVGAKSAPLDIKKPSIQASRGKNVDQLRLLNSITDSDLDRITLIGREEVVQFQHHDKPYELRFDDSGASIFPMHGDSQPQGSELTDQAENILASKLSKYKSKHEGSQFLGELKGLYKALESGGVGRQDYINRLAGVDDHYEKRLGANGIGKYIESLDSELKPLLHKINAYVKDVVADRKRTEENGLPPSSLDMIAPQVQREIEDLTRGYGSQALEKDFNAHKGQNERYDLAWKFFQALRNGKSLESVGIKINDLERFGNAHLGSVPAGMRKVVKFAQEQAKEYVKEHRDSEREGRPINLDAYQDRANELILQRGYEFVSTRLHDITSQQQNAFGLVESALGKLGGSD